ncbi:MAG: undecaprenyl-diphosphate phosphatase [Oscillospiraceae bacterium]|nr:undecaprenyl-diphosphate phosphatase [Oscillospiraceae bacterium]
MNWIEGLLYGLISGISEFLPISSRAHQSFLQYIFGVQVADPVMQLFVHGSLLAALFVGFKPYLEQIRRNNASYRTSGRGRRPNKTAPDERISKNAVVPLLIVMFLISFLLTDGLPLPLVAVILIANGILLYLPERFAQGNKAAGSMSMLDSWLMGIASGLSILPGVSGIGASVSVSLLRGADRRKAVNWALLIAFYTLCASICLDFFAIIAQRGTVPFFSSLFSYITAAAAAYCSGFMGVKLVKLFTAHNNYCGFAYYSWGMALFVFLMYLIVI